MNVSDRRQSTPRSPEPTHCERRVLYETDEFRVQVAPGVEAGSCRLAIIVWELDDPIYVPEARLSADAARELRDRITGWLADHGPHPHGEAP